MNTLTDKDPMPFGKHKGKPMKDVPASYLHWLWHNGLSSDRGSAVWQYVQDNRGVLETETPDPVWD